MARADSQYLCSSHQQCPERDHLTIVYVIMYSRFVKGVLGFSKILAGTSAGLVTLTVATYAGWTVYGYFNIDFPTFQKIQLPTTNQQKSESYEIRRYAPLPIASVYKKCPAHFDALFLGKDELLLFLEGKQNTRLKKIPYFEMVTCQKIQGVNLAPPLQPFEVWMTLRKDDPFVGKSWNPYISVKDDFPGYRAAKKFRGKLSEEVIEQQASLFADELTKDNVVIVNPHFRVVNYTYNFIPYACLSEIEYEIAKPDLDKIREAFEKNTVS